VTKLPADKIPLTCKPDDAPSTLKNNMKTIPDFLTFYFVLHFMLLKQGFNDFTTIIGK
jgi:hypothetical protein